MVASGRTNIFRGPHPAHSLDKYTRSMMAGFNYNKQFVVCTSIDNEYKRCCCILELEGQANVEWEDLHLKVARMDQHPQLWLDGLDGC